MTDGIDPTRLRRDTGYVETNEPPPAHRTAFRPVPDLTDLPEASFGPLPHVARRDVSTQRVADPPKTPVQTRLDAFLEHATPDYTVDGRSVRVPIPFRMAVDLKTLPGNDAWRVQEKIVIRNSAELQAAAASVGLGDAHHLTLLRSGRATPEDVQKVTQALIDRGRLPSANDKMPDAVSRVRSMMFDYGIGIDCAGYTQQAYLESRGLSRGQTKLNPNIANENLTNLTHEGFQKVPIDEARAGDVLVLDPPADKPPPGHTLIVYDRREPTATELAELRATDGFKKGHITAYVLDSSFGSQADFNRGGVMRQIWWRNDDDKSWARIDPQHSGQIEVWPGNINGHLEGLDQPYSGHLVHGLYRPAGETP